MISQARAIRAFAAFGEGICDAITGTAAHRLAEGSEEWAWAATDADQAAMLAAMKKGAEAVVTAQSARGTQTKDTFSLRGFTAAVEEAEKRCQ